MNQLSFCFVYFLPWLSQRTSVLFGPLVLLLFIWLTPSYSRFRIQHHLASREFFLDPNLHVFFSLILSS